MAGAGCATLPQQHCDRRASSTAALVMAEVQWAPGRGEAGNATAAQGEDRAEGAASAADAIPRRRDCASMDRIVLEWSSDWEACCECDGEWYGEAPQ